MVRDVGAPPRAVKSLELNVINVNRHHASLRSKLIGAGAAVLVAAGGTGAFVAAAGPGSPSAAPRPTSSLTDASAQPAGVFVAVSPLRVLDTRPPSAGGPIGVPTSAKLASNATLDLRLSGTGYAIPANATAAMLNITIDEDASLASYLTVWPKGETRPYTSANNALPGLIASNSMLAKIGADGSISIYNQQGAVNVVIDLVGYTVPLADSVANGAGSVLAPSATPMTVAAGVPSAVTFTKAGPFAGSVAVDKNFAMTVSADGLYSVSYDATITSTVSGNVAVFVHGVLAGPATPFAAGAGILLADEYFVLAKPGDAITLVFTPDAAGSITVTAGSLTVEQVTAS